MIKALTAMSRRTPISAILLAPVALFLLVLLWNEAFVPLYRSVWYSNTVLQWRLDSERPQIRADAIKDAVSPRAEDTALLAELISRMQTDESPQVRKTAATALGQIGSRRPLPAEAVQALSEVVLTERDDGMLSAGIKAVGQSAPENRYPDQVVERIAEILHEPHLAWLYSQSARVLGQISAAQPLPEAVLTAMSTLFTDPVRPGERENLANAFTEIAKRGHLPVTTLDILAHAFEHEPNRRIRIAIIYALAHGAADYPQSTAILTAATGDPNRDVVTAAEHGMRIIEYGRTVGESGSVVPGDGRF